MLWLVVFEKKKLRLTDSLTHSPMDLSGVIVFETVCVPYSDLMLFAQGVVVVQDEIHQDGFH